MPPSVSLVYELYESCMCVGVYVQLPYYPKIIFFVHSNELQILEFKCELDFFLGSVIHS